MREFYDLINHEFHDIPVTDNIKTTSFETMLSKLPENLVGRMYALLYEAQEDAQGHPDVLERIYDLVLYTRYVELYLDTVKTKSQELFEELVTFSWRIRKRCMVSAFALMERDATYRIVDESNELEWPGGEVPGKGDQPPVSLREKEDIPYSEDEILDILKRGVSENEG